MSVPYEYLSAGPNTWKCESQALGGAAKAGSKPASGSCVVISSMVVSHELYFKPIACHGPGARPRGRLDRRPDRNFKLAAQLRDGAKCRQLRAGQEQAVALWRHGPSREFDHLIFGNGAEFRGGLAEETVQGLDPDAGRLEIVAQAVIDRLEIRRHHRGLRNARFAQHVDHGASGRDNGRAGAFAQGLNHRRIAVGAAEEAGGGAAIDHEIPRLRCKLRDRGQCRLGIGRQIFKQQRARRTLDARHRKRRERRAQRGNFRLHRGVVLGHHDQGLDVGGHQETYFNGEFETASGGGPGLAAASCNAATSLAWNGTPVRRYFVSSRRSCSPGMITSSKPSAVGLACTRCASVSIRPRYSSRLTKRSGFIAMMKWPTFCGLSYSSK